MKPTRLCPFCFNPLADNQTLLEEENAKLRELVRDMWSDLQVHGYKVENILRARYERRMRELRVEVDNAREQP